MRILFVTGEYPPQTGGVGAYTRELARDLVAQGIDVTVLTAISSGATRGSGDDAIELLPIVDKWGAGAMRAILAEATRLRADWLHVQYQTAAFAMNAAVNLAPGWWRAKINVAWTYHDLLPPYLFPKAGARLRDWVTLRPTSSAHAVVATNHADCSRLKQVMGDSSPRLHNIPIGSNIAGVTLDPPERSARRSRYGVRDDQLLLGYFGALNRTKGAGVLLDTLELVLADGVDAHLLMIGDALGASDPTNAAHAAEVQRMIADRGLTGRIHWTGRESEAEVAADLNALDTALLPYTDGASLRRGTLMAALANGCAIITTEPAAPIPELQENRDLLYVPRSSEEATAHAALAAIQRLRTDASLAATLRTNARTRSQFFAWHTIAARHIELYSI